MYGDDNHSHSPRDIGAADDHDLDMLRRDTEMLQRRLASAERTIAQLESDRNVLARRVTDLEDKTGDLQEALRQHMEHFVTLGEQVLKLAAHVAPLA